MSNMVSSISKGKPRRLGGLNTLINDPPTFVINDYKFRFVKLTMKATFELLHIIKTAMTLGYQEASIILQNLNIHLGNMDDDGAASKDMFVILSPLLGIPDVSPLILNFFKNHIQVEVVNEDMSIGWEDVETLDDSELFPMGAELVLFANLIEHPSIVGFFTSLHQVMNHEVNPNLKNIMNSMQTQFGKKQ